MTVLTAMVALCFGLFGSATHAKSVQASGEAEIGRRFFFVNDGGTAIVWSGMSGQHIPVACYEEGDAASVDMQHRCADADEISSNCKSDGYSLTLYKGGCAAATPLLERVQIVPGGQGSGYPAGTFALIPDRW